MESKFSHLSQRDNSVSMLRVKMSRRRSQTQKENRERTVNTRRQLEKLMELDVSSLEASAVMANMSVIHEKTLNGTTLAKSKSSKAEMKTDQKAALCLHQPPNLSFHFNLVLFKQRQQLMNE